jgi:hypothetical protein
MYEQSDPPTSKTTGRCYGPEAYVDQVLSIVEVSGDCLVSFQIENGWNNLVHTPLLAIGIFSGPVRRDLVHLTPW